MTEIIYREKGVGEIPAEINRRLIKHNIAACKAFKAFKASQPAQPQKDYKTKPLKAPLFEPVRMTSITPPPTKKESLIE